jgi:glycerophosphoryl diester phosphodiesterase
LPTSSIKFDPPIIAHRGANNLAPENTLAAFAKVKQLGVNWIEFDVMLAACGEAVVIHDDTLERTTNGSGRVCDYPYSVLRTLDAGSWFAPEFSQEKIPTFKEVIELVKREKLYANVEIKSQPGQEEQAVKKILADIAQFWPQERPPLISSFSMLILKYVRQYAPDALLAILIDDWFSAWDELAEEYGCASLDINHQIVDAERVQAIKNTGKFVLCYTVNTPERARTLFSWGVDAVFTDNVDLIMQGL